MHKLIRIDPVCCTPPVSASCASTDNLATQLCMVIRTKQGPQKHLWSQIPIPMSCYHQKCIQIPLNVRNQAATRNRTFGGAIGYLEWGCSFGVGMCAAAIHVRSLTYKSHSQNLQSKLETLKVGVGMLAIHMRPLHQSPAPNW